MKPAKKIEKILFDVDIMLTKKNDRPITKPTNTVRKSRVELGFKLETSLIDEKKINPKKNEKRRIL